MARIRAAPAASLRTCPRAARPPRARRRCRAPSGVSPNTLNSSGNLATNGVKGPFPGSPARALEIACFLRNSRPKSADSACGKGASSLRARAHPLMSDLRRRGASPCRAVWLAGSHQVASPGLVVQVWVGRVVGERTSGEWGARGSSIGAVALGGYGTLSR